MNRVFTARSTLELVASLEGASQRNQERRQGIESEFLSRKLTYERDTREKLNRLAEEEKSRRAQLVQEFELARESALKRSERRAERIVEAHASSKRKALQRIEQEEGRRKYFVQKESLEAEKNRAVLLAQGEADYHHFQQQLGERNGAVQALRREANASFSGYPMFRGYLAQSAGRLEQSEVDEHQLLGRVIDLEKEIARQLKRFKGTVFPVLFRFVPIWLCVVLFAVLFGITYTNIELPILSDVFAVSEIRKFSVAGAAAFLLLYIGGLLLSRNRARSLALTLVQAEGWLGVAAQKAQERYTRTVEQVKAATAERIAWLDQEWKNAIADAELKRETVEPELHEKYRRALEKTQALGGARSKGVLGNRQAELEQFDAEIKNRRGTIQGSLEAKLKELQAWQEAESRAAESEWEKTAGPLLKEIAAASAEGSRLNLTAYKPAQSFSNVVPFGRAAIPDFAGASGESSIPLQLKFPEDGSLVLESNDGGRTLAIGSLNNIVLNLLAAIPPGKVSFTIVDPVALGQSFSAIMHLADYEENIVNRRIWTEPAEIEEQLLELNAHMEKVIQMYLRNEFTDIVQYNQKAGRVAEKLHFLVVADFPANFSDNALRRLLKIAASGAKCGVYLLLHWDKRRALPPGFMAQDLTSNAAQIQVTNTKAMLSRPGIPPVEVTLEQAPAAELTTHFLRAVGEASRGSNVVQVPFSQVVPEKLWTMDTTEELRVPVGRAGATRLQYLALGKGTRQHVLIAGKTGSGKSTLLHVIVTNLSLWSSPEQVEFYLIDFKKGVEFKDYATFNLPHARVVAIESDREFGLSVLRRVDEELRQRGELFRKVGVQDLPGFKRTSGQPMPRLLLIIDEFQELFVEEDSVSQDASMLLDRIVRQGRAFGIHVILGSQTLGGAYTLPRTTLAQMVVRIALQCTESDAYLIMDENNPAPRLLSRPGEGIYNDSGGITEANSPFQTVWLPEGERREILRRVRGMQKEPAEGPIVFEGNALADIRDNVQVRALVEGRGRGSIQPPRVWLGLPNEIKGPTEAIFQRQGGNNLLLVGRSEESILVLMIASLVALSAQMARGTVRFVVLESGSLPGSEQTLLTYLAGAIPHETEVGRGGEAGSILERLVADLTARETGGQHPLTFVFIRNISALKALKPADEFSISYEANASSPAANLERLLVEGPGLGIHFLVSADSYANASRFLGRKGLKEFQTRVLFQMSANDSANLCDDPRASQLGLYRALLYQEQEGRYEVFRPYALPSSEWLNEIAARLAQPPEAGNESKMGGAAA